MCEAASDPFYPILLGLCVVTLAVIGAYALHGWNQSRKRRKPL